MAHKKRGEKQYTDSFLDRSEAGHRALVVTVFFLIGILIITIIFLVVMYTYRKQPEEFNSMLENAQQLPEGEGTLIGESEGESAGEETVQTEEESVLIPYTEMPVETEKETQPPTEKQTEAKKTLAIDAEAIEQIMAAESDAASWGVYVYDLTSGSAGGAGESEKPMYTSACLSIPILYAAAERLDQGAITLNDPIVFVNSIGGRGLYNAEEIDGSEFPFSWYLKTMLQYSDNNCINCLLDYMGLDNVTQICRSAGFESTDIQRKIVAEVTDGKENYISAKDLAGMVKEIYNGRFKTIGRSFMAEFCRIDGADESRTLIGLCSALPEGILLLNQNGRGETRYSEVAVVVGEDFSYVVSVMLMGENGFYYEDAVKDISGLIYRDLTGNSGQ